MECLEENIGMFIISEDDLSDNKLLIIKLMRCKVDIKFYGHA